MNRRLGIFLGILAALALSVKCWAAPERSQPGVAAFASEALQRHRPLFETNLLERLDSLNRRIREAERQLRQAPHAAAQEEAAAELAELARETAQALESAPGAVRLFPSADGGRAAPLAAVELPGRRGGMLLRIGDVEDSHEFLSIRYDFSNHSHHRLTIEVNPHAATWVLLGFENAPRERSHWELEIRSAAGASTIFPLDLVTPAPGALQVTILSDETGAPAPAMVQLVWKRDGEDFRPANALDFAPQFDRQGTFLGPRRANYPGKWAGRYWCVPGPFHMEAPAGEWEIRILRGIEYAPVVDSFAVAPGETVTRTYRPERWTNMAERGWYSGDDHVHGQLLSDRDADNLMTWIRAEDVRVANVVKMGDIHRTWFEQRGFGERYRVERDGHVLSPGQECPRTHGQLGHTIHMNISRMIRDTTRYFLYDTVFEQVKADGGLSGYAHVNTGLFHVHRDMTMNIPRGLVDFVELLQFTELGTGLYYEFLNLGFPVTASAGSDVPWGGTVGEVRVYAFVGDEPFSADRWFDAVARGRTFVTNGVMVDLRVDDALPGDQLTLEEDRPLRIRASAWGDARRLLPARLEVVVNGEVVREAVGGEGKERLELEFDLPAGFGCWIAVRAEGDDDSRAHTTPVYAVRPPYRFWKLEAVDALIDARLESLSQIEEIVKDAIARRAAGEAELDRATRELAVQGRELMQRVDAARALYEDLRAQAAQERRLQNE